MNCGRTKCVTNKETPSPSKEDVFIMLDFAFTKAKDNGNKITLAEIQKRVGWETSDLLHTLRSRFGKELFKEVVGGRGIFYAINAKYVFVPVSSMHDFIKNKVFSKVSENNTATKNK